jgi:hypothetical protein
MRNQYWKIENTVLHTWFERDRANVRLESDLGDEIICLWDNEVESFIEDSFKKQNEHWHDALIRYANEHDLIARGES